MTREELAKTIREDYERKGVWACKVDTINMQLDFEMLGIILEALEQEPKTIQEIQAESEKYQKAFEDGYEQGYAQARFDYEQEPCEDVISRQAVLETLDNNRYSNEFCDEHNIDWSINLGMAHIAVNKLEPISSLPCSDTINLQKVLEQINCWIGSGEYRCTNATEYLTKRIKTMPSVKLQEPKTGHWKRIGYDIYECSICGQDVMTGDICAYKHCHGCGARMESEES